MSSTLLKAAHLRVVKAPRLAASYAKKAPAGTGDSRVEIIRNTLYPSRRKDRSAAPTGVHRSDVIELVKFAIPSAEAHETIERAWQLHQRSLRLAREAERRRKFDSMKRAMEELEKTDNRLFRLANVKPDPRRLDDETRDKVKGMTGPARKITLARVDGLFPREMRIPTDTPPRAGWDHDWKAFGADAYVNKS